MDIKALLDADLPVPHEDGSWVSEKVSRITELIRQYDHNLDVRWIRPEDRHTNEPHFAIVERLSCGMEVVAFYVQDESSFDETVLERIFQADASKAGNALSTMDAKNHALKMLQMKKHQEELEEQIDIARSILRSPKHEYRHDGKIYD